MISVDAGKGVSKWYIFLSKVLNYLGANSPFPAWNAGDDCHTSCTVLMVLEKLSCRFEGTFLVFFLLTHFTGHTDFTVDNKNLINFWYVKTSQNNYKQISIHIKVIEAWFIFHPLPSMNSICLEKTYPKQWSSMIVIKFWVPAQEILNYPILIRLFLLSGDRKINI